MRLTTLSPFARFPFFYAAADGGAGGGAPPADGDRPITQAALNAALAAERKRREKERQADQALIAELKGALSEAQRHIEASTVAAETIETERLTAKERIERIERQLAEAKERTKNEAKARQAAERERVLDTHRQQARALLAKVGVGGDVGEACVALMERTGVLKFDATDGKPQLTVTRVRAGDRAASAETFDSIDEGIADWLKSPGADEWKPVAVAPRRQAPEHPRRPPSLTVGDLGREPSENEKWERTFARIGATEDDVRRDLEGHGHMEAGPKPSRDPRGRSEDERLADLVQRFGVTGE